MIAAFVARRLEKAQEARQWQALQPQHTVASIANTDGSQSRRQHDEQKRLFSLAYAQSKARHDLDWVTRKALLTPGLPHGETVLNEYPRNAVPRTYGDVEAHPSNISFYIPRIFPTNNDEFMCTVIFAGPEHEHALEGMNQWRWVQDIVVETQFHNYQIKLREWKHKGLPEKLKPVMPKRYARHPALRSNMPQSLKLAISQHVWTIQPPRKEGGKKRSYPLHEKMYRYTLGQIRSGLAGQPPIIAGIIRKVDVMGTLDWCFIPALDAPDWVPKEVMRMN